MKKNRCLFAFLGLSIACASANSISRWAPTHDTVVDEFTGLEWQREEGEQQGQKSAAKYCQTLVLDGKKDWRLPTIKELSTLGDRGKRSPAIDSIAFPNTSASKFWTSSLVVGHGGPFFAWNVNFDSGLIVYNGLDSRIRVRCVR